MTIMSCTYLLVLIRDGRLRDRNQPWLKVQREKQWRKRVSFCWRRPKRPEPRLHAPLNCPKWAHAVICPDQRAAAFGGGELVGLCFSSQLLFRHCRGKSPRNAYWRQPCAVATHSFDCADNAETENAVICLPPTRSRHEEAGAQTKLLQYLQLTRSRSRECRTQHLRCLYR